MKGSPDVTAGNVAAKHADLEDLLRLAHDKTMAGRRRLLAIIADLFAGRSGILSDRERALMGEIMRQLIRDLEIPIRRAVADMLAAMPNAPSELVVTLANDQIEVAYPILTRSEALRDLELIEIVRNRTFEHQLAISIRKTLSGAVADALVQAGNADVIRSLLQNRNAAISVKTMEYLVEQAQRVDTFHNPLVRRPELTTELANRLYWSVSAALRAYILGRFEIESALLDEMLERAVHDCDAKAADIESKSERLAGLIEEEEPITPQLILYTLRQGEVPLFTALFARFTGLQPLLVQRMIFEADGEALAVASRGSGIDKSTFASIFVLTRKAHSGESMNSLGEIAPLLALYDRVPVAAAAQMLERWQRNPSFLHSAWELDPAGQDMSGQDTSGQNTAGDE